MSKINLNQIAFDNDLNKISSKEELIILLEKYKNCLQKPIIDYLESLIEIEFSVIKENIGNDERIALSELEVYKKIAIYNIYNHAFRLATQNGYNIVTSLGGLSIYPSVERESPQLYNFDCQDYSLLDKSFEIPKDYKTMQIGEIHLYHSIENGQMRERERERISYELQKLYTYKEICDVQINNCSHDLLSHTFGLVVPPNSYKVIENERKIKAYENKLQELNQKKEITEKSAWEIEITNDFYYLLLEEYGLTNESFVEEKHQNLIDALNKKEKTNLRKTRVKKMPNINIYEETKYI